jgi:hypothetical protein
MHYIAVVRRMIHLLPHLRVLTAKPRRQQSSLIVTWHDFYSRDAPNNNIPQGKVPRNFHNGYNHEELKDLQKELRDTIPVDVQTRLIVAQDLTKETIDFLGDTFQIPPEVFAEHLHASGYTNAKTFTRSPQDWTTSEMVRDYFSVRWLRPVLGEALPWLRERSSALLDTEKDGLEYKEKKSVQQGGKFHWLELQHYVRASSNIIRDYFPISPTPSSQGMGNAPTAWVEKVTIWKKLLGSCIIGKILSFLHHYLN